MLGVCALASAVAPVDGISEWSKQRAHLEPADWAGPPPGDRAAPGGMPSTRLEAGLAIFRWP